ncbi:response regulator [Thermoproteota archaeon]
MKTILLIDDNNKSRDLTKFLLYQEGFTIQEADNYNTVLKLINDTLPDLIIINTDMLSTDSFEIIKHLLNNIKTQQIPLIALTDSNALSNQDKLTLLKCHDYVSKPINEKELLFRIKKILKIKQKILLLVGSSLCIYNDMTDYLLSQGFQVLIAKGNNAGLESAQKYKPELILLDSDLPEKYRNNFTQSLSKDETLKTIPLLLMADTKDLSVNDYNWLMTNGDYILKPIDYQALILRIKKILSDKKKFNTQPEPILDHSSSPPSDLGNHIQKAKEQLLHQVTVALNHEIRSPLTSILIGSQALHRKFSSQSDEKQVLEGIEKCARRIKEIMDSLESMKEFVVDDYMYGVKMLDLSKSSQKQTQ